MSEIEKMGPTARRLVACKIQRALEDYLTERKLDPRYAHEFEPIPPAGPSRISASNHELLSSNLERIARGEAAVVFDGS